MKILKTYGNQGDLSFRKIDEVPRGVKKFTDYDPLAGGYTLAVGEHTSHKHTLVVDKDNDKLELFIDDDGRFILQVKEAVELWHGTFVAPAKIKEDEVDKHNKIRFEPGIYQQDYEQAYEPFLKKIQRVID